ncbi:hypothetical protein [Klebsiella grimontii]|nr:hypothetical protein [Klebsiella grimontii]
MSPSALTGSEVLFCQVPATDTHTPPQVAVVVVVVVVRVVVE